MKISRISASVATFAAISLLAACGGGGGGGGVNPPTGGGGGGTPPTMAPTTAPTSTPTVAPTATPVSNPTTNTSLVLNAVENFGPNGALWYTGGNASYANTAGPLSTSAAADGSQSVDGMSCTNTPEGGSNFPAGKYSQHLFVGIMYNGQEQALPQALGMVDPVAPTAGTPSHKSDTEEVEQNKCEYNVHTHDYSGLVHVEDASQSQNNAYSYALPYATLQSLFDLWGAQLTANGIVAGSNSLTGPVTVYVGTPDSKVQSGTWAGDDLVTTYTQVTGNIGSVPLARHNVIWIVVGDYPAQGLPEVQFGLIN